MTRVRICLLLALIPTFQAAMVLLLLSYNSSPHHWIPGLFALPVPFIAYMALWYKVSLLASWQRTLRAGVLAFGTFVLTMGAYALFMIGGIVLEKIDGISDSPQSLPMVCGCRVTNWTRYSPPGGGFSVSMPGPPTVTTITNKSAAGPYFDFSFISTPSRSASFLVHRTEFPPNAKLLDKSKLFEKTLKTALGSGGKLLSEASIHLHGHEGRQWKIEVPKRMEMITMRLYLVNHQLYIIMSSITKHRDCPRHTREFLNSFDLLLTESDVPDSKASEEPLNCQLIEAAEN